MPVVAPTAQPDAPPTPRIEAWVRYIRAMEDAYQPSVSLPPEEVHAAATWAARLCRASPPAPARPREAVLTR